MQIVWAHHARCFGKQQLEYLMGTSVDSPGHSFVTGWGTKPPVRPHHRNALCGYVLEVCPAAIKTAILVHSDHSAALIATVCATFDAFTLL